MWGALHTAVHSNADVSGCGDGVGVPGGQQPNCGWSLSKCDPFPEDLRVTF